jgi:mitogen-activated protein kinase kinase kinase 3
MPFWCPGRWSRPSSKRKDGHSASACCSPRHSVDAVPPTAYAPASASPSDQWERAWARSLGSPAPRRGAVRAAGGCGSVPGRAAAGRGLPLPRPVYRSAPQLLAPPSRADAPSAAAARGGSPVSSGSSSESDEAADTRNHRYELSHLRGIRADSVRFVHRRRP